MNLLHFCVVPLPVYTFIRHEDVLFSDKASSSLLTYLLGLCFDLFYSTAFYRFNVREITSFFKIQKGVWAKANLLDTTELYRCLAAVLMPVLISHSDYTKTCYEQRATHLTLTLESPRFHSLQVSLMETRQGLFLLFPRQLWCLTSSQVPLGECYETHPGVFSHSKLCGSFDLTDHRVEWDH